MSRITTLHPVRLTSTVWHADVLREHVANICRTCHATDCYLCALVSLLPTVAVSDVASTPLGVTSDSGTAGSTTAGPPTPRAHADDRALPATTGAPGESAFQSLMEVAS